VTAKEDNAYKNVQLERNVYMLQLPDGRKVFVDVFHAVSPETHQYDLPFQYKGQFIQTSFAYQPNIKKLETLGTKNGYQFLWKEAEAKVADTTVQFTFLNANTFYTISSLIKDSAQLFFTLSGANDPKFNIRHEPAYIIRQKNKDHVFVNELEIHGNYDQINEFSTNAYSSVKQIRMLLNDKYYTVISINIAGKELLVAQANADFAAGKTHRLNIKERSLEWKGPYTAMYGGQSIFKSNRKP